MTALQSYVQLHQMLSNSRDLFKLQEVINLTHSHYLYYDNDRLYDNLTEHADFMRRVIIELTRIPSKTQTIMYELKVSGATLPLLAAALMAAAESLSGKAGDYGDAPAPAEEAKKTRKRSTAGNEAPANPDKYPLEKVRALVGQLNAEKGPKAVKAVFRELEEEDLVSMDKAKYPALVKAIKAYLEAETEDEDDEEAVPKKKKKPAAEEEDEDEEPAPKKKKKPVAEEEDEEPAPKKKKKPVVDEDED